MADEDDEHRGRRQQACCRDHPRHASGGRRALRGRRRHSGEDRVDGTVGGGIPEPFVSAARHRVVLRRLTKCGRQPRRVPQLGHDAETGHARSEVLLETCVARHLATLDQAIEHPRALCRRVPLHRRHRPLPLLAPEPVSAPGASRVRSLRTA